MGAPALIPSAPQGWLPWCGIGAGSGAAVLACDGLRVIPGHAHGEAIDHAKPQVWVDAGDNEVRLEGLIDTTTGFLVGAADVRLTLRSADRRALGGATGVVMPPVVGIPGTYAWIGGAALALVRGARYRVEVTAAQGSSTLKVVAAVEVKPYVGSA